MDKQTIKAAIKEADQSHSKNFKALQSKGKEIGQNLSSIKETDKEIAKLKALRTEKYAVRDLLKEELTVLKVREADILATKGVFEKMLESIADATK